MRQKASNYTAFRIITSMTTSGLGSYATYIFFARTRIFHPNILIGQKITRKSRRVGFVQTKQKHQTWNQSILIGRTTSRRNWCVQAGTSTGQEDKPHPWISWTSWGRTRRVGLGHCSKKKYYYLAVGWRQEMINIDFVVIGCKLRRQRCVDNHNRRMPLAKELPYSI